MLEIVNVKDGYNAVGEINVLKNTDVLLCARSEWCITKLTSCYVIRCVYSGMFNFCSITIY